jgi:hypothetical protein
MKKPSNRIDMKKRIEIYDFMKPIFTKGVDGYWHYEDNWSDTLVAGKMSVSEAAVRGTRQQLFGHIRATRTFTNDNFSHVQSDLNDVLAYLTRIDPQWRDKQ